VKVDLYERVWMWAAALMIAVFIGAVVVTALSSGLHPPSHTETIDPRRVRVDTEFAAPGVSRAPDGSTRVVVVTELFTFDPPVIRVPARQPVIFRLASPDVIHGFQIVGTNANVLVAPGYVSEMTAVFPTPGEYLIVCNEYCGRAHHLMQGRLIVEAPAP
jgi:cytochrome c oxidase subunit 2